MAATVCSSELSQVFEYGQRKAENDGKTHACRAESAVHLIISPIVDDLVIQRLRGYVGDATAPGTAQIT